MAEHWGMCSRKFYYHLDHRYAFVQLQESGMMSERGLTREVVSLLWRGWCYSEAIHSD